MSVVLTSDLIESFAGTFLSPLYDNPQPTPQFHRDAWELYTRSGSSLCAVAAPRAHAKSTALTHDYALAVVLFRVQDYVVIVSATEELSIGHLGDIAKELRENDDIIAAFAIKGLVTDSKTDIVVEFLDGHQCRIVCKGSGQKMRGMKWRGKRPGLILCDDLEEDEQVENRDRRVKFQNWFLRALLPCRRRGGLVRVHGTILHEDSLLAQLIKSPNWDSLIYRAHASFDDFSEILWPEQFPEDELRSVRQSYINLGNAAGYSQEYLNDPFDNSEAYLRKDDFLPMVEEDFASSKQIDVGCDFAVSKADRANRTSFSVGGTDSENMLYFLDQFVGRWDSQELMDVMFDIERKWHPRFFFVEDGVIWKTLAPTFYREMRHRGVWLNCVPILPTRDKATRGRPFQKRMRAGGCKFDKAAEWYVPYESELLRFTGFSDAVLDDQFDSSAILVKGLDNASEVEEEDFYDEEEVEAMKNSPQNTLGRSSVCGY